MTFPITKLLKNFKKVQVKFDPNFKIFSQKAKAKFVYFSEKVRIF